MRQKPHGYQPLVLVVDDDMTFRCLAQEALESEEFRVIESDNGADAIAQVQQQRPDIVLMDVMMPKMDGFTSCREIRKLPRGDLVPVVLVTGLDDTNSVRLAYEVGATDFVSKPFNGILLSHRLKHIYNASQAFLQAHHSQLALANAQRLAKLGNWTWVIESDEFMASNELYNILGLPAQDGLATHEDFLKYLHPGDLGRVKEMIADSLKDRQIYESTHRVLKPTGEERWVRDQAEIIVDETLKAVELVGTTQDVTDAKMNEKKIQHLAFYDDLTGLPNRTLLMDRLGQAISVAKRNKQCLAVLFLDLDRFKRVNDTLGHNSGDLLLKKVTARLSNSVRQRDTVSRAPSSLCDANSMLARLGGDEFTVVLNDLKYVQDPAKIAQRIIDSLTEPFNLNGQEVTVTASIGISVFPTDGENVESLLKHADTAMYHAKRKGQNQFQFYSPAMNASALDRLMLENSLRRALNNQEFELYFQPQLSLENHNLVGVESLVRWHHPEWGLTLPDKFLGVAEESGLVDSLDQLVITSACAQWKFWKVAGFPCPRIAVNLSNVFFRSRRLVKFMDRVLRENAVTPGALEIELTENIVMENPQDAISTLLRLKSMGLVISIDDFGTGYSSLAYLKELPIDTLKIDKLFIHDLETSKETRAIVKSIISLSHSLNFNVVAEGVETWQQFEFLSNHGCDVIQGYLLCRPMTAEALAQVVAERVCPKEGTWQLKDSTSVTGS